MKNKFSKVGLIFLLLLFFAHSVYASNIMQIAVGEENIPFMLDDEGQVWTFRQPLPFQPVEPYKLENLNHIKKIAPYIAIDDKGQVFTWRLHPLKTYWDENGLVEAVYTTPQQVEGLQGVTQVASSSDGYFVAVIGDKEIVDWMVGWDKAGSGTVIKGVTRKVASRPGVKSVAALWSPEDLGWKKLNLDTPESSLVALFDDGSVIGWGIQATGIPFRNANWNELLLTKSPGATKISLKINHTIILTAGGEMQYLGGCGGININGQRYSQVNTSILKGEVADVVEMSPGGYYRPGAFIKRDGSVWVAYAPAPPGMLGKDCYQKDIKRGQFWKLPAGKAAAVQVAARNSIFMLDAEHQLWVAQDNPRGTRFHNLNINLK